MTTFKMLNSKQLAEINDRSDRLHFNAIIPDEVIYELDPKGVHLVNMHYLHQDECIRAEIFIKLNDIDDPKICHLDMTFDDFASIEEVEI